MAFTGKWKVTNFEEQKLFSVLDAFGVPESDRDRNMILKGSVDITQNGDNFTMNATGGLGKKGTHTFTVGNEVDGELFGKKYHGNVSWDGDVVVFKGQTGVVLRRAIESGNLVYTVEYGGKSGRIFFTK
ncbi:Gastrotropin [Holothuria leucospilota]|uniref:Gastrotropin n=1 Tax=Holothuria leucospilota TaxID=206669 RepID=A0A9Q1HGZ2_HOLLE|nr:Gastrotropin [Holothuria leucospilota]